MSQWCHPMVTPSILRPGWHPGDSVTDQTKTILANVDRLLQTVDQTAKPASITNLAGQHGRFRRNECGLGLGFHRATHLQRATGVNPARWLQATTKSEVISRFSP